MSGGGGGSTTTTGVDPFLKPYIEYGLKEGQKLYESAGPQFYQGQTYVSPSAQSQTALNLATQRAISGSPLTQAAQQQQLATIQGQGANPYLTSALEAAYAPTVAAAQEATRGLQGTASRAGRYGSDAMAQIAQRQSEGLGRGLGQSLSNLAYQSSEAQAARAQQAAQNAPAMAQADYADIQALLKAGQGTEQYQQAALQDAINRYNYEQNLPQMKLQQFANLFSNVPGGQVSTTTQSGGK
jgi:hypothetical protein